MSTNATTEDDIRAALVLNPRIPDPDEIAVAAEAGTATLRGTVGSFRQRRAAVGDTRDVAGIYDVDDELEVRLLDDARRDDTEIRGIALQVLMWDVEVPADMIEVKVSEGWITLSGQVSYQFESDAAYDDAASLFGVLGITNEIKVVNP